MKAIAIEPISFLGCGVLSLNVSATRDMPAYYELGMREPVGFTTGNLDIRIDVEFVVNDESQIEGMGRLMYGGILNFSSLGATIICKFCGHEVKAGSIVCHRCGGNLFKPVENSKYDKIGQVGITDFKWHQSADRGLTAYMSMRVIGALKLWGKDTFRKAFSNWTTTHVEDGWICKYCGGVVKEENLDCPHCGGGRVPFTDLAKMRHKCLYCGASIDGNTVCMGCGASSNGYSVWLPRLDWN